MSVQDVKFYQTDTFTVGNRLLLETERAVQANMRRTNSLNSGHRACQGCGEALGARYAIDAAMHATGNRVMAANATGCLEVFSTPYPETSWQIPWIHSLFGNAAAVASGMAAAMRVKGRKDVRVIAQGGDGGTTDIGFGCLSGMFERNDDVLYVTRAMAIEGARYIHIHVPCPLGWGSAPADTIKVARMAVESGLFPVFEAEHGEITARHTIRHKVPVEEYLKLQRRFAHLFGKTPDPETIERIQATADRNIRVFGLAP